jgi:hypothetical protein
LNRNSLPSQFGLVITAATVAPAGTRRPLKQPAQRAFQDLDALPFFSASAVAARAERAGAERTPAAPAHDPQRR